MEKYYTLLKLLLLFVRLIAGYIFQLRKYRLRRYQLVRAQMNLLVQLLDRNSYGDIRCTFYVQIWCGVRMLMQTFDYIRFGDSYGGWRLRSKKKGIIGIGYKEGIPMVENFKDKNEFDTKMVNKYNFSLKQANERTYRESYLCYPIKDGEGSLLGLMYFDSDKYGSFNLDDNHELIKMIRSGMEAFKSNLI